MQTQKFSFAAMTIALLLSTNINAQSPSTGTINGHDYVDLGLSVVWATCNIGASKPSDYGNYYAWGEAETKSEYTEENSATYGKDDFTFHDAAAENWGGSWRMPTKDEFQELIDNCTWQWTTVGGHNGYMITSEKNGNSIFLPAAGHRSDPQFDDADEWGLYWSSSPSESNSNFAYNLLFFSGNHRVDWDGRDRGKSIRPVSE